MIGITIGLRQSAVLQSAITGEVLPQGEWIKPVGVVDFCGSDDSNTIFNSLDNNLGSWWQHNDGHRHFVIYVLPEPREILAFQTYKYTALPYVHFQNVSVWFSSDSPVFGPEPDLTGLHNGDDYEWQSIVPWETTTAQFIRLEFDTKAVDDVANFMRLAEVRVLVTPKPEPVNLGYHLIFSEPENSGHLVTVGV